MMVDERKQNKQNVIFFSLAAITTLVGPIIYIFFASLYHFVLLGLLFLLLLKGFYFKDCATPIIKFSAFWFFEAAVSCIWAPDKQFALKHVYYVFLIFAVMLLIHNYINNKIVFFNCSRVLVILLFICNVVAVWEVVTGHHLQSDYLGSEVRLRLLKYMPGTFFHNPNDSATNMIFLLPFSLAGIYDKKRYIKIFSVTNIFLSVFSICASQSRTQIIIALFMLAAFLVVSKKVTLLWVFAGIGAVIFVLYLIYPDFQRVISEAFESISKQELQRSAEVGSGRVRINLFKNGLYMLVDTGFFGVGAGSHRVYMPLYSEKYYYTGSITVMHNFLGELLVDYGLWVAVAFIGTIIKTCFRLFKIFRKTEDYQTKIISIMMFFAVGSFVICGLSSSSIVQLTSLWIPFGVAGAITNINKECWDVPKKKTMKNAELRLNKRGC